MRHMAQIRCILLASLTSSTSFAFFTSCTPGQFFARHALYHALKS